MLTSFNANDKNRKIILFNLPRCIRISVLTFGYCNSSGQSSVVPQLATKREIAHELFATTSVNSRKCNSVPLLSKSYMLWTQSLGTGKWLMQN